TAASFLFQAEDGIRDRNVTGVQTCALPIFIETVPGKNGGRERWWCVSARTDGPCESTPSGTSPRTGTEAVEPRTTLFPALCRLLDTGGTGPETVADPWGPAPLRSTPTKPFEGLHVLGVRALRSRGLQRDGDPRRDRVAEQLPEGLGTDVALADVFVPVLVAAARNLGVVSVDQLQTVGTHHLAEAVQGLAHSLRGGDVVPRSKQVRGVQAHTHVLVVVQCLEVGHQVVDGRAQYLTLPGHRLQQHRWDIITHLLQQGQEPLPGAGQPCLPATGDSRSGVHHHAA